MPVLVSQGIHLYIEHLIKATDGHTNKTDWKFCPFLALPSTLGQFHSKLYNLYITGFTGEGRLF